MSNSASLPVCGVHYRGESLGFVITLLCVGVGSERNENKSLFWVLESCASVSVKPQLNITCLPDNHKMESAGVFTKGGPPVSVQ